MGTLFKVCYWMYKKYFWDGKKAFPDYYTVLDFLLMLFFVVTLAWWFDLGSRAYSWVVNSVLGHRIEDV